MNWDFFMSCFAIAAVVIVVSFFLIFPENWKKQSELSSEKIVEEDISEENYKYLLKNYDGKLALYFYGEKNPEKVFDVYIKTLPEYDQIQLDDGVFVESYEKLLVLLEDYSS